jgi:hypothetical protein
VLSAAAEAAPVAAAVFTCGLGSSAWNRVYEIAGEIFKFGVTIRTLRRALFSDARRHCFSGTRKQRAFVQEQ